MDAEDAAAAAAVTQLVDQQPLRDTTINPDSLELVQSEQAARAKAEEDEAGQAAAKTAAHAQLVDVRAICIEGMPYREYNGLYAAAAVHGGWYRFESAGGKHLYRHVHGKQWYLRHEFGAEASSPQAFITAPKGPLPIGEHRWQVIVDGNWREVTLSVSLLFTETEVKDVARRLRAEDEAHAAQLTVGALVTWSLADKDIPRGTVGEIIQVKKDGTRRARFPAGHMEAPGWNFQPKNLTLASGDEIAEHKRVLELVVGVAVLCKIATSDLPAGTVGEIIEVKDDTARRVRFPMGTWVLKPDQILQANAHQVAQWVRTKEAHAAMLVVGVSVTWTGQNDKIPKDTRGIIIAVRGDGRRRVQFPAIIGWLEAGELIVEQEPEPEPPQPLDSAWTAPAEEGLPGSEECLRALERSSTEAVAYLVHVLRNGDRAEQEALAANLENRAALLSSAPGTATQAVPAVNPSLPAPQTAAAHISKPHGYTAGELRNAASRGDCEGVRRLLASGVHPDTPEEMLAQWGPLHYAALSGHTEAVQLLIAGGAKVDAADRRGETPIRQAAYWGHTDAAAALRSEYEKRGLQVGTLPHSVVIDTANWEKKHMFPLRMGEKHHACILCSTPEFGVDGQEVMVELFGLCDQLSWLTFGYDWGGSSTAEPADKDPNRLVPDCCLSLACSCANRSSTMVKGPVDWSNAKSVSGSVWFPKYWIKVVTSLMSEAQRPGMRIIEMLAINGGPVSQLERRTMPAIIANAVDDLRAKGISISAVGSDEETKIKVLLRTHDISEFYMRLEYDTMFGVKGLSPKWRPDGTQRMQGEDEDSLGFRRDKHGNTIQLCLFVSNGLSDEERGYAFVPPEPILGINDIVKIGHMINGPETSRSLSNRSYFALALVGGRVPVLYHRFGEDMFDLQTSKLPLHDMDISMLSGDTLELTVPPGNLVKRRSRSEESVWIIESRSGGGGGEPDKLIMRLPQGSNASDELQVWAKLLIDMKEQYKACLHRSYVTSCQVLADVEDGPLLPGTRVSVAGHGEGIYQQFNRSKIGANQHTIAFAGGAPKKVKLKGVACTVIEPPPPEERRWVSRKKEIVMLDDSIRLMTDDAVVDDPQLEHDIEVLRQFVHSNFGKSHASKETFHINYWGGLSINLMLTRKKIEQKDEATAARRRGEEQTVEHYEGRPVDVGTTYVQLFALLRAVAHKPLSQLDLSCNRLTDDEAGLALAANLPYFHDLHMLSAYTNRFSLEVQAAIEAAAPNGCEVRMRGGAFD